MPGDALPTPDNVSDLLTALEHRLRVELAGSATVERRMLGESRIVSWTVRPANPRALTVSWLELRGELVLTASGRYRGGHWELDRSVEDVEFIESVVRAVVAGRVVETAALARSRVEIVLADGQVVHETGYEGCLLGLVPLPGWQQWGRTTRYEPYD